MIENQIYYYSSVCFLGVFSFYILQFLNYTLSIAEVCEWDKREGKTVCSLSALRSVSRPEIDKTLVWIRSRNQ